MNWKRILLVSLLLLLLLVVSLMLLARKPKPESITYGVSFNTPYAQELGLNWQEAYDAIIDELGVKHFRLAAHWPMVEPSEGDYNFTELDYQVKKAESVGATVIMAVGRRLPRWPECHIPAWASQLSRDKRQAAQLKYMKAVVERYKDSPAIKVWQVENEPFLSAFAFEHCGELDEAFLKLEVSKVKEWDPTRPILVTDSVNLGTWAGAYRAGDMFGTSVYVYFWNPDIGQFKTFLPPWFYRVKDNLMRLLFGDKPTLLIELSAEPWLLEPVEEAPLEVQFSRMNLEKFSEILDYARETRYDKQYLWGAEWWYWLKKQGHPEFWNYGQDLFAVPDKTK